MKSSRVVLFIFSVLLTLGILCVVFPAEGVTLGGMTLGFPSLEQALGGDKYAAEDEPEGESPEEILARRLTELRAAEESEFIEFAKNSPTRIFFPDDDPDIFDDFFDALDSAMTYPMRIVHYGDSQLEEDRITNNVRQQLQERFGGSGAGMMPLVQPYTTLTLKQIRSNTPVRSIVYGTKEFQVPSGKYGPMGQAARLHGSMDVTFSPNTRLAPDHRVRFMDKVTILTDAAKEPLSIMCGGSTAVIDTLEGALRRYVIDVPDSSQTVSFRISGNADVYGVLLDGEAGVSLDNVAMRGCSGTIFTRIDAAQLADFYSRENVRLIILQYGGNAVPYMRVGKSLDEFGRKIYNQICYVREQAPDAAILFIGPSDMSTNVNGSMRTYPALPAIIDTLRSNANRAGAAYWDLYQVMGGNNSMVEWVRSGYAGKDYIHFTHKGADEVGNLLAQSLLLYYDYYKWRKKPLTEQLTPDVIERLMRDEYDKETPEVDTLAEAEPVRDTASVPVAQADTLR